VSTSENNAAWIASQQTDAWITARQTDFAGRTGAAVAFWPELKRALLELIEEEPIRSRVQINVLPEEPNLLIVSAGLFELKFAADVLSDTIFYAFTSTLLKKLIPRESAIFHHGHLNLSRGPWGVIDNPGPEVHKTFVAEPDSVETFPLADQVARWSLEQLLGGYPKIAALEAAVAQKKEAAAKKEAKDANAAGK
jgi:hypothetical protein